MKVGLQALSLVNPIIMELLKTLPAFPICVMPQKLF